MRKTDFTLPTLDDLFTTQAERDDAKLERVKNIPLDELHPFKDHPYYNKFGTGARQPAGLHSISCLSYNKRSNWLANHPLVLLCPQ